MNSFALLDYIIPTRALVFAAARLGRGGLLVFLLVLD